MAECTFSNFQLELGSTATEYEPYKTPTEHTPAADGTVSGVTSLYPSTTLITNNPGAILDVEYSRDINKAFAALTPLYDTLEELDEDANELI